MTASFIMMVLYIIFSLVVVTGLGFIIVKYTRKNKKMHSEQPLAFTSHKEK